jgi:tartrate-resistant acid phosphatase type 5
LEYAGPVLFHEKSIGKNAEVLLVFIDTNPLEPNSYNSSYRDELIRQDSTKQKQWLEKVLADTSSSIKWKIVIGHHPLYTAGNRALNKPEIRYSLEGLFEKYKVNVYISGHEHHLQYYHPPQKFTHHFISGAGSEANTTLKPRGPVDFFAPIQGFMTFSITADQLVMQAIDRKSKVLKNAEYIKINAT